MNLNIYILLFLLRMGGQPATFETVCDGVRLRQTGTPNAEIQNALNELEAEKLISGATIKLLKTTSWTLTDKGRHAALQLA